MIEPALGRAPRRKMPRRLWLREAADIAPAGTNSCGEDLNSRLSKKIDRTRCASCLIKSKNNAPYFCRRGQPWYAMRTGPSRAARTFHRSSADCHLFSGCLRLSGRTPSLARPIPDAGLPCMPPGRQCFAGPRFKEHFTPERYRACRPLLSPVAAGAIRGKQLFAISKELCAARLVFRRTLLNSPHGHGFRRWQKKLQFAESF